MMAVLALCGLLSWTTLLLAPKIQSLLADKDRCVNSLCVVQPKAGGCR